MKVIEKRFIITAACLILLWAVSGNVSAGELKVAPFSASFSTTYAGEPNVVNKGRVFVDEKGVRIETVENGEPTVFIYSFIEGESWVLIPQKKVFMQFGNTGRQEAKAPKGPQDIIATVPCEDYKSSRRLGVETIRGRKAEKWACVNPDKSWAYEWFDKRLKVIVRQESSTGSVFELYDVAEGPQPPGLFTVPKDYVKMGLEDLFR